MGKFALGGFVLAVLLVPRVADASCIAGTPDVAYEFEGVALPGPAEPSSGQLTSPARFLVERWIEGDGPGEVEVATAVEVQGEFVQTTSEGITPKAGERWRIRGDRGEGGVILASVCTKSELIGAADAEVAQPPRAPEVQVLRPTGSREDSGLSLGVAAAGAVALAVVISRRPG